jgi:hypothetical protein
METPSDKAKGSFPKYFSPASLRASVKMGEYSYALNPAPDLALRMVILAL